MYCYHHFILLHHQSYIPQSVLITIHHRIIIIIQSQLGFLSDQVSPNQYP